jgi:DNA-binding NtrC family response regulator
MKTLQPSIVFFAQKEYSFIRAALENGSAIIMTEPSELFEAVKQQLFPIILFDTMHSHFSESMVMRVYRKIPDAEFWLLSEDDNHGLPDYLIDAVLPHNSRKSDFKTKVEACLRVKALIEEYGMIGKSANLKRSAEMIAQVAPTDMSTLIIGPSGSGKELVARAIHRRSLRVKKTFLAINCGALAEGLLESELFGYEKGAFTGAVGRREGIFKRADRGTVFLDEVGETSPAFQVKLLRVLEDGNFYRVGGSDLIQSDVRIVAATNRELTEAISEGDFRDDLYFRLGAVRINLLGLTERKSDIIPLVNHFFKSETGATRGISRRAMELLLNYSWPGNVRQLHNFVNRMIVAGSTGEISEHLVMQFFEEQGYSDRTLPVVTSKTPQEAEFQLIYQALLSLGQEVRMLRDLIMQHLPSRGEAANAAEFDGVDEPQTMDEMEEEMIRRTIESVDGNRRAAARKLGIGERTLYRKLKKFGMQ